MSWQAGSQSQFFRLCVLLKFLFLSSPLAQLRSRAEQAVEVLCGSTSPFASIIFPIVIIVPIVLFLLSNMAAVFPFFIIPIGNTFVLILLLPQSSTVSFDFPNLSQAHRAVSQAHRAVPQAHRAVPQAHRAVPHLAGRARHLSHQLDLRLFSRFVYLKCSTCSFGPAASFSFPSWCGLAVQVLHAGWQSFEFFDIVLAGGVMLFESSAAWCCER